MKQCPNPNCIYYTRLEELPDAYVRCPSCGGQLVNSSTTSGVLRSGHLPRISALPGRDLDDEFQQAFPEEALQPAPQVVGVPTGAVQHEEGEYYPYDESSEYEVVPGPPPLSRFARFGYIAGGLLLIIACGLFVFVIGSRIFQQAGVVPSPQATQTALASIRPAINTPISELPTANVLPTSAPPTSVPPTNAPPPPPSTDTPSVPVSEPPTSAPVPIDTPPPSPPAPTAQVNATAPPAQSEPSAGVLDAFMTSSVQGGQSLDIVTTYGASDTFVLAVQAQFGPDGVTSVLTRWYGPDGGLLYEFPRSYSQSGTYYSTFNLRKSTPWLEGSYRVDIYTNDGTVPAYTVNFAVSP